MAAPMRAVIDYWKSLDQTACEIHHYQSQHLLRPVWGGFGWNATDRRSNDG